MRVMVLVKANEESEAGEMPSEQLLTEMMDFNEELVKAGVMLAGDGLHPSSKGARVAFSGSERKVIDGPFAETKELLAGYWVWQVKSLDEAIEWVKRMPEPRRRAPRASIEIRPVFEADDFGEELTPELREQEQRLRAQTEARAGSAAARADDRRQPHDRRRLADRVGAADRRASPGSCATSASPRTSRRRRSSPRSSSGPSRASRTTRAPGSWPPPSTARSTACAAPRCTSARRSELGREIERPRRGRGRPDLDGRDRRSVRRRPPAARSSPPAIRCSRPRRGSRSRCGCSAA